MDPVEGRVEAHLRRGRDDRADDTADEGDDGEHEDEDPGAALEGTAAAIGIGAPHAKFAFVVCRYATSRALRCEGKPRTLRLC